MTQPITRARLLLLGVAALALGGGAVFALSQGKQGAPSTAVAVADDLSRLGANADDVTLTSDSGEATRWGALKGKPRAVFFGFTHCPVICPVTVWELNNAMDKIGAPARGLSIQFVSLDPERDTPAVLKAYFSGFDGRVQAFSGTADATARIARAYGVVYQKAQQEGADYVIDHTATVFLLDGSGRVVDVVAYGTPPEVLETRLRALLAGAQPS